MTRENIIKMAQEVGLIRAGENYTEPARWGISEITDFYNRAVAAEREACAQIAKDWDASHPHTNYGACISNAIRARGNT